MSKDKKPAILEAVAGLPIRQCGLVLGIIKTLKDPKKYPNASDEYRKALKAVLTPVAKVTTTFLKSLGKVTADVTEPIDLETFFESKKRLWVNSNFKKLFVTAGAKFVPKKFSLSRYKIKNQKGALDSEVQGELPENHVFQANDFVLLLATMIKKQWGGKTGVLTTNDRANIFYVQALNGQVFAVRVYWYSDDQEWGVDLWKLDDGRWLAGRVVFSCN